ncbi:MAG: helix-turn-helix domain-containing protein [Bacteroidota bacterium]
MERLVTISKSQTAPHREVNRANILLQYMDNKSISGIARDLNTNRPLVERCINKAIAYGAITALKDLPGRGVKPKITDDAKH